MALLLPAKCDAGAAPVKTINPHKHCVKSSPAALLPGLPYAGPPGKNECER
jgi:hypothetical protein